MTVKINPSWEVLCYLINMTIHSDVDCICLTWFSMQPAQQSSRWLVKPADDNNFNIKNLCWPFRLLSVSPVWIGHPRKIKDRQSMRPTKATIDYELEAKSSRDNYNWMPMQIGWLNIPNKNLIAVLSTFNANYNWDICIAYPHNRSIWQAFQTECPGFRCRQMRPMLN